METKASMMVKKEYTTQYTSLRQCRNALKEERGRWVRESGVQSHGCKHGDGSRATIRHTDAEAQGRRARTHAPLLVVLLVGALDGLEGVVGREEEADHIAVGQNRRMGEW